MALRKRIIDPVLDWNDHARWLYPNALDILHNKIDAFCVKVSAHGELRTYLWCEREEIHKNLSPTEFLPVKQYADTNQYHTFLGVFDSSSIVKMTSYSRTDANPTWRQDDCPCVVIFDANDTTQAYPCVDIIIT